MGRKIDIAKVAAAIEADAGESLPGLRQALAESKAGIGRVTTPEQILVRQAREKSGLTQAAFAARIETPVVGSEGFALDSPQRLRVRTPNLSQ
jgi:putative transcriptional regulator